MRIVQVGMGGFGRDWAEKVVPTVSEVKPVGYVDMSPAALTTLVESGLASEAMCFSALPDAIEATSPDAVLVTANLPGHVPCVRTALEAGKHVLVEKPFAPSVAEALEVVELAAERELTVMVSQNYRFFPAVRAVRALVAGGELGALHTINIDFRRPVRKRSP
jgi:predicted dehydrogenase